MATELSEQEVQDVLKHTPIGRIGCADNNSVYIIPVNYHYEDNAVLCYSLDGHKIDIMRSNPIVCFEVEQINDSGHWKCVIIDGVFEEITDEQELAGLRPKYTEYLLRVRASMSTTSNNVNEPSQVFYRIRFTKISGRVQQGLFV